MDILDLRVFSLLYHRTLYIRLNPKTCGTGYLQGQISELKLRLVYLRKHPECNAVIQFTFQCCCKMEHSGYQLPKTGNYTDRCQKFIRRNHTRHWWRLMPILMNQQLCNSGFIFYQPKITLWFSLTGNIFAHTAILNRNAIK